MQVAIVLYPGFTALDVIGPYEVFGRLPDTEVVFVAESPGTFVSDLGSLSINVVAGLGDVPKPDVVVVGGGPGRWDQMADGPLHEWLRSVDRTSAWTTSVCTGAFILASAGLFDGRTVTTHWGYLEDLTQFGATPSTDRIVVDGHYVSAAGVSAGIDMALTLAGLMLGEEAAQTVQLTLEYAPEPPYDAGSVDSAPQAIVERAASRLSRRSSVG